MLEQSRFRAAYDLMLLRCEFGIVETQTAEWWTKLQTLDKSDQEIMIFGSRRSSGKASKKKTLTISTDETTPTKKKRKRAPRKRKAKKKA